MDATTLLAVLLDDASPEVADLPRFGRGIGGGRKIDRAMEYVPLAGPVALLPGLEYGDMSVSAVAIQHMTALQRASGRVVPYSGLTHRVGELAHYFDGVWVLSGAVEDERLVCYWVGANNFVALHYCANASGKDNYKDFLGMLERRWYHVKATAQNL